MKRTFTFVSCAAAVVALTCSLSPAALSASRFADPSIDFAQRVLASHNAERVRMGMAPLRWNVRLSEQARQWADVLARRGSLQHSGDDEVGENLWMGWGNRYSPEQMVGDFISERRAFRPGRFPNVSNTGSWADVGHYTQIIWPETREVGCALSRGGREEVMVCRYWPAGNVEGERVG
jgi:uncharacterized protein YkwD